MVVVVGGGGEVTGCGGNGESGCSGSTEPVSPTRIKDDVNDDENDTLANPLERGDTDRFRRPPHEKARTTHRGGMALLLVAMLLLLLLLLRKRVVPDGNRDCQSTVHAVNHTTANRITRLKAVVLLPVREAQRRSCILLRLRYHRSWEKNSNCCSCGCCCAFLCA